MEEGRVTGREGKYCIDMEIENLVELGRGQEFVRN
jgi:hypothetical protein